MEHEAGVKPFSILAVLGPSAASAEEESTARRVGALAAKAGWTVLTGGGPGVMESACRGAIEAGGLTVAVLPTSSPSSRYPNPWVRVPIYTGAGSARNFFNVLTADLCVAIGGGPGTLSEIALAMKCATPVWCYRSWGLVPPPGPEPPLPRIFDDEDELLAALKKTLKRSNVSTF